MDLKKQDASGAWVVLTSDDLLTICNALNEVCNGLEIADFPPRIGVPREEALNLFRAAQSVYEKTAQHT